VENGARERKELERAVVVDCRACRALCEQTLGVLLDREQAQRDDDVVRSLMTTAAVTEAAASWLDDERHVAVGLLEFCADACDAAVTSLGALAQEETVRDCAETCRACADTVRALLWASFEEDG
jgi:hypothetical protein